MEGKYVDTIALLFFTQDFQNKLLIKKKKKQSLILQFLDSVSKQLFPS